VNRRRRASSEGCHQSRLDLGGDGMSGHHTHGAIDFDVRIDGDRSTDLAHPQIVRMESDS
jgi:hypothetical protein